MDQAKLQLCPYCRKKAESWDIRTGTTTYQYQCRCCGEFKIPYDEILRLDQESDEYRKQYHAAICENASA